jgi:hypothetical protein
LFDAKLFAQFLHGVGLEIFSLIRKEFGWNTFCIYYMFNELSRNCLRFSVFQWYCYDETCGVFHHYQDVVIAFIADGNGAHDVDGHSLPNVLGNGHWLQRSFARSCYFSSGANEAVGDVDADVSRHFRPKVFVFNYCQGFLNALVTS